MHKNIFNSPASHRHTLLLSPFPLELEFHTKDLFCQAHPLSPEFLSAEYEVASLHLPVCKRDTKLEAFILSRYKKNKIER